MVFAKNWFELPFGKHQGKIIPQIAFTDPSWLFWAMKKRIFKEHTLIDQAIAVKERMSSIRIPDKDNQERRLIFYYQGTRRYRNIKVEDAATAQQMHALEKACQAFIINIPDLWYHAGSKTAMNGFMRTVKYVLFNNESAHMTADRCGDFFNDPENFVLRCNLKVS